MPSSRERAGAACILIARILVLASWALLALALARIVTAFDRSIYGEFVVASVLAPVLFIAGIALRGRRYGTAWIAFDFAAVALMLGFIFVFGAKF